MCHIVSVIKFGLASRFCQRIVGHEHLVTKARALLDKKRQRDLQVRNHRKHKDPRIVQLALEGDLGRVIAELQSGAALESCATWTETEDRNFYEKSWDWKNDTPLSMACSQGNLPLVQMLLDKRANPHHKVCNECDVHYTPLSIAVQLGHSHCARAIKAALHAEEEEKARKIRETAAHIFHAATNEASLRAELEALSGQWQNQQGRFSLERQGARGNELLYRECCGIVSLQGTLSRKCDGWWQGALNSDEGSVGFFRIRLSKAANRADKTVHQIKELPSEKQVVEPWGWQRDMWGAAMRSIKLVGTINDEEAAQLLHTELARREARLESRRQALRDQQKQKRRADKERFRQEMQDEFGAHHDEFGIFEDDIESELGDEYDDDFQHHFRDEDDTDEEKEQVDGHVPSRGHAFLLLKATKHLKNGEGGAVDLARSAQLCAMALSLEQDEPVEVLLPEYSTFGKAMKSLRELASTGVPEALEALPYFTLIEDKKKCEMEKLRAERAARQRAEEEERRKQFEELRRMESLRKREAQKKIGATIVFKSTNDKVKVVRDGDSVWHLKNGRIAHKHNEGETWTWLPKSNRTKSSCGSSSRS